MTESVFMWKHLNSLHMNSDQQTDQNITTYWSIPDHFLFQPTSHSLNAPAEADNDTDVYVEVATTETCLATWHLSTFRGNPSSYK